MSQLQLKQIGSFLKVHGFRGELILSLKSGYTFDLICKSIKEGDAIFVETDGIPVPFFISENGVKEFNQSSILIKLDGINDKKAMQLVSSAVLLENAKMPKGKMLQIETPEDLIGYQVSDSKGTFSGEVLEFLDLRGNPMLNIKVDQKTMLLPLISDFILSVDDKRRKILLELPEGYLETML